MKKQFIKNFVALLLFITGFFISFAPAQAAIPSSGLVGSFDGATATSVPHTSSIDPGSSLWTVSALVKGAGDGIIIWKGGSPDYYELAVSGGKAVFAINAGGTTVTASAVSSASINDGNWHSITGVRSATKTVDVYVDGVFSGTATYIGSGTAIDTTTALTIGSKNGANNFSGNIGNVYLYNRALSVLEIQDIYSTDIGAGQISLPPTNNTDTTVPSTNITSPSAGSIVFESVSISANASDNVAVLGVQFKIDGMNLGNEDTSSPYQAIWDSTSVPNGSHTVSVVARDAAGNTNADSINVSVNNSVSSPSPSGCSYPAQILDLTDWKVTMPENTSHAGAPDEYFQPELSTYSNNAYFKVNSSCDGVQFLAPISGYTTSGSSYPRSELREMTSNGTVNASWGTNDGKPHTMFIDQAITAVPTTKKHIVVGQIHDSADDVIVIRLEYPKLFVDINGVEGPTLDANYTLGKRFTVKFVSSGGQTKIYYNGSATPAYTLSKNGNGYYFKAGAYTQSNCSKEASCSPSNYGEVHIYNLWVSHSSDNPPQNSTPPPTITPPSSGGTTSGGSSGGTSGGATSGGGGVSIALTSPAQAALTTIQPNAPTQNTFSSPLSVIAPNLVEGDLIRGPDGIKVYIVNAYGFKRHIFNPTVFNMYGHLKWDMIKSVDQQIIDALKTSNFYRADGDPRVFSLKEIDERQGKAQKQWLDIRGERFTQLGYRWEQVFTINTKERDYYQEGAPIKETGM